mmetsp:Transcript_19849/g.25664  ORF Transcript_19849/g.25664 Transcript_19849/m.25664 type:complete len:206 (-) Transcript_19849:167-784(-)
MHSSSLLILIFTLNLARQVDTFSSSLKPVTNLNYQLQKRYVDIRCNRAPTMVSFPWGGQGGGGKSKAGKALSAELYSLLAKEPADFRGNPRVDELIQALTDLKAPFDLKLLQGPWKDDSFSNYAELWGKAAYIKTLGTFKPVTKVKSCPYQITAYVDSAFLSFQGKTLDLPIQGEGVVNVLYADPLLRIFQNENGGIAVQTPLDG